MSRLTDRVLALRQLGLRRPLEIAARALRPELEQFFQRGESVACGRGRILTEGDPLQRAASCAASRSAGENSNDRVSSLAISAARAWIRRGE